LFLFLQGLERVRKLQDGRDDSVDREGRDFQEPAPLVAERARLALHAGQVLQRAAMSDPIHGDYAEPFARLLEILELEPLGSDRFRAGNEVNRFGRLFGGQVVAQALVAAARTVDARLPHSLHAYFLKTGNPDVPIEFEVHRVREGRTFATRRVLALQGGEAILNLASSFQREEPGDEHQLPMPHTPPPEGLKSAHQQVLESLAGRDPGIGQARVWLERPPPVEWRPVRKPSFLLDGPDEPRQEVWFRFPPLGSDDPLLHRVLLAYATDLSLLDVIARTHGLPQGRAMLASLDHAVWFQRHARVDQWLLFAQESPAAAGARGLARGMIYTREGRLVASVAQEGLMRRVDALPRSGW
jgi:acyl-CoA thioesterase-2